MRLFSVFILPLVLISYMGEKPAMAIEEPKFEVVRKFDDFEVRRYEPRIVAETQVQGELESSGTEGFRRLAGYIFGSNRSSGAAKGDGKKISMTAPVESQSQGPNEWRMTFTMPREWTMETLPVPNDARVKLVPVPGQWIAVLEFSGTWSEARFSEKADLLRKALSREGLTVKSSQPQFARYNPPMMPWFLRRNEVWFEINPLR